MTNDLVSQFLAKGGAIKRAPEGIAYGVNKQADAEKRAKAREDRAWDGVPILATVDHLGRGWYTNAEGEVIGHD